MPVITRDYDFSPGTTIVSAQVDSEFDKIYNLLNGSDLVNSVAIGGPISNSPSPDPKFYVEGQSVFLSSVAGAVLRIFRLGSSFPAIDLHNSGEIRTLTGNNAAAPSTGIMMLKGCMGYSSANVGNVGGGVDTLKSFTIAANTFASGGTQGIIFVKARGYTAANANNKTIKFFIKTTELLTSGAVAFNNRPWFLDIEIGRDQETGNYTVVGIFRCDTTEVRINSQMSGFDPTVDNTISITGEAIADNDIVCNLCTIEKSAGNSF